MDHVIQPGPRWATVHRPACTYCRAKPGDTQGRLVATYEHTLFRASRWVCSMDCAEALVSKLELGGG